MPKYELGDVVRVVSPNGRTHYAKIVGETIREGRAPLLHLKALFSASGIPIRKGAVNLYDPAWIVDWKPVIVTCKGGN